MADDFDPQDPKAPDLKPLIDALVEGLHDVQKLTRWEKMIANAGTVAIANGFGLLMKIADSALDKLAEGLEFLEEKATPIFSPFLARIVGHILGADVSTEAIHQRLNRAGSSAIGTLVTQTFYDILAPPVAALEPGDAGAKRMMGALGHMTVNGWAEPIILEWIAEYCGWHINIESITHLAHELIGNLGINRLSRVALRPLVQTTVATPLQWQMNKLYRPTLLTASEAVKAFYADVIDEPTMLEVLHRQGYGDDGIAALKVSHAHHLTPADVDMLVRFEVWSREDGLQALRNAGLDSTMAHRVLYLEELKTLRQFQLAVATNAVTAFADNRIDEPTMLLAITSLGLDQRDSDRQIALAHHHRETNVKHLTRGEVEQAVLDGILSVTDYAAWLERHNYATDDALTLELMLQHRLQALDDVHQARATAKAQREADRAARKQAAQAKRDALEASHAHFSGTPAQAERLVERGLLTSAAYLQILTDHGIAIGDASELAALAQGKADAYAAAAKRRLELAAKQESPLLSVAALELAVRKGVLSLEAFDAELVTRKYSTDDILLLRHVLERQLADQAALEAKRAAAAAKLTMAGVSLADEERAVREGLLTMDAFRAWLVGRRFGPADVALLVGLLQEQLKDDADAAAVHAAAAVRLAASHVSLADEETAVLQGLRTLEDLRAFLASHDFHPADVALIVSIVERKIADAAAAAAKRDAAAAERATRNLSLAQEEAAVVAGILTEHDYADFLTAAKLSPSEVATVVALLHPKVVEAAQGRARLAALALEPGEKTTSLQQRRAAVLDGVSTVADFRVWLEASDYGARDIALLVADLEATLAHAAAAAAAKAAREAAPPVATLTLAQIQQAVKDGIRSLDDYRAELEARGYSLVDVATLVDELAQQLPAPAAPEA